ncbi:hypothetical protein [Lactococcus lactis]|uniref:hypothetical protein n=1 Tax=Lactococcus lactis TaxID=1358 RepID=UPI0028BF5767|nr:hypothetical protein [Lactococcus lactis]WNN67614.1 hypothetical protein RIN59_07800 [Lactococcus lactis]WPK09639.1 hypothetical protein R6U80_03565 [Lactococcus lactis]
MAYNKKALETKIQTLGQLMETHKYDEAWTIAGEINSIVKTNKDTMTGSEYEIAHDITQNFYAINRQVQSVNKRAFAMGKKAQAVQL